MNVEQMLGLIAGFFVLLSVAPAHFARAYWLLFTACVGLKLLQSGFNNWRPMTWILKKAGVSREGAGSCCRK
ncbi:MAG TPA: DUF2892 domain-containing protein [Planctomycetota bacterium]|jgi:hypothetical protein|nr:DUF2892 domain-containing protein [Planctomycetota bacterium]OQC19425.1 MAG: hypothetical protein BWX69_02705 [Planctomycetes bacterium ADurb.Bin069]HNS00476.1 DUF2892 domain-containing protein [Planctomycetota bacterium]HNU27191.1 DUF2892 domain-containing protein [Planctomycetota bacterium]HOE31286.1 DUF2892 domain-containing protein [Planctomycetota bacterium]